MTEFNFHAVLQIYKKCPFLRIWSLPVPSKIENRNLIFKYTILRVLLKAGPRPSGPRPTAHGPLRPSGPAFEFVEFSKVKKFAWKNCCSKKPCFAATQFVHVLTSLQSKEQRAITGLNTIFFTFFGVERKGR